MRVVNAATDLATFRSGLTGHYGVSLVRAHGQVLVQLPVGVGKSTWLDAITLEALRDGFDLVVVLSPTRALLEERAPLKAKSGSYRIVNLRPRPHKTCGPQREAVWSQHITRGANALAKQKTCDGCPFRKACFWPGQYGSGLQGARIVYATQAHLEGSPHFISHLKQMTRAKSCLVLMDESRFIAKPAERIIKAADLVCFQQVLTSVTVAAKHQKVHESWKYMVSCLLQAKTDDLASDWKMPGCPKDWVLQIQKAGMRTGPDDFRFLCKDLKAFSRSNYEARLKNASGDLHFTIQPDLGEHCMVFSGTTSSSFANYRYSRQFTAPFSDCRFVHPETRWYNIASRLGMQRYFSKNQPQILDFYAALIARRISEGKRPLLVCKKALREQCADYLQERLRALGHRQVHILTSGFNASSLAAAGVVPLIHYGTIGINLFEHFDTAYCLTGYYVNERVVNQCLQDVVRQDLRLSIQLGTTGLPLRRYAGTSHMQDQVYDVHTLAPITLEYQELDPVLQVVGRVRPFTQPREIVTFQCSQLPGVTYDQEFNTLAEAREHFAIGSRRTQNMQQSADQIRNLLDLGLSQREVAVRLNISERTVRRRKADTNPL